MRKNRTLERMRNAFGTSLFASRDYRLWLASDTSWQFGTAVRSFAMLLVTQLLTGSTVQAGILTTTSSAITMLSALPGGVLVDRFNRKTLLIISGISRMLIYSYFTISLYFGFTSLRLLYIVGISGALVSGLFGTASNSSLKSVVPTNMLAVAASNNQGRDGVIELISSPISGILIGFSHCLPFACASLGGLFQALFAKCISTDLRPEPDTFGVPPLSKKSSKSTFTNFCKNAIFGFTFIKKNRFLRRIVPCTMCANAGIQGLYVAIVLIMQNSGFSSAKIGLVSTDLSAGMLLGALLAGRLISSIPTGLLIQYLFIIISAASLPILFCQKIAVILGLFFLIGLAMPTLNGAMGGYSQFIVPIDLQGRVSAANMFLEQGLPAVMPALVGCTLEYFDASVTLFYLVLFFIVAAILMATNGKIRQIPVPSRWSE